ncbi:unnamed protein product [Effrenium voratum]|uniref:DUF3825 domain-containing protein n=1 Tax=Effrenium voratum TaxID=2562239 RepID=A0AA36J9C5_9DINO|nr:unnamed protein product [Effrenium voratum]
MPKKKSRIDAQNEFGSLFYVPIPRDPGPEQLQSEEISAASRGYAELIQHCKTLFEERGAKKEVFEEPESDEEENADALRQDTGVENEKHDHQNPLLNAFKRHGFNLVYFSEAINVILVDQACQTHAQKRRGVNVAVARYIYHKFGAPHLERIVSNLRGDVLVFKASQWDSEEACRAAPFPQDDSLRFLQNMEKKLPEKQEEDLQFLVDRADLASVMASCVIFLKQKNKRSSKDFEGHIADLERKAQPEDWRNRLRDSDGPDYLINYVKYKFALSWRHKQGIAIKALPSDSSKLRLTFATGLVNLDLNPIFGIFERKKDEGDGEDCYDCLSRTGGTSSNAGRPSRMSATHLKPWIC